MYRALRSVQHDTVGGDDGYFRFLPMASCFISVPASSYPNPGSEPRSPTLQADSLPAEPQGKPKNTGVGSLSLLQGIFPTQELDWGLLHPRWIHYQLSYEGSQSLLSHYLFEKLESEEMASSYICYTNNPPSFTHISPIGW